MITVTYRRRVLDLFETIEQAEQFQADFKLFLNAATDVEPISV
jgi:hypothetical protein